MYAFYSSSGTSHHSENEHSLSSSWINMNEPQKYKVEGKKEILKNTGDHCCKLLKYRPWWYSFFSMYTRNKSSKDCEDSLCEERWEEKESKWAFIYMQIYFHLRQISQMVIPVLSCWQIDVYFTIFCIVWNVLEYKWLYENDKRQRRSTTHAANF